MFHHSFFAVILIAGIASMPTIATAAVNVCNKFNRVEYDKASSTPELQSRSEGDREVALSIYKEDLYISFIAREQRGGPHFARGWIHIPIGECKQIPGVSEEINPVLYIAHDGLSELQNLPIERGVAICRNDPLVIDDHNDDQRYKPFRIQVRMRGCLRKQGHEGPNLYAVVRLSDEPTLTFMTSCKDPVALSCGGNYLPRNTPVGEWSESTESIIPSFQNNESTSTPAASDAMSFIRFFGNMHAGRECDIASSKTTIQNIHDSKPIIVEVQQIDQVGIEAPRSAWKFERKLQPKESIYTCTYVPCENVTTNCPLRRSWTVLGARY